MSSLIPENKITHMCFKRKMILFNYLNNTDDYILMLKELKYLCSEKLSQIEKLLVVPFDNERKCFSCLTSVSYS